MSSSVVRREGELAKYQQETQAWLESDKFINLEDRKEKLITDLLPGFRLSLEMDEIGVNQYLTIFTYKPQQDLTRHAEQHQISEDVSFNMYMCFFAQNHMLSTE